MRRDVTGIEAEQFLSVCCSCAEAGDTRCDHLQAEFDRMRAAAREEGRREAEAEAAALREAAHEAWCIARDLAGYSGYDDRLTQRARRLLERVPDFATTTTGADLLARHRAEVARAVAEEREAIAGLCRARYEDYEDRLSHLPLGRPTDEENSLCARRDEAEEAMEAIRARARGTAPASAPTEFIIGTGADTGRRLPVDPAPPAPLDPGPSQEEVDALCGAALPGPDWQGLLQDLVDAVATARSNIFPQHEMTAWLDRSLTRARAALGEVPGA